MNPGTVLTSPDEHEIYPPSIVMVKKVAENQRFLTYSAAKNGAGS